MLAGSTRVIFLNVTLSLDEEELIHKLVKANSSLKPSPSSTAIAVVPHQNSICEFDSSIYFRPVSTALMVRERKATQSKTFLIRLEYRSDIPIDNPIAPQPPLFLLVVIIIMATPAFGHVIRNVTARTIKHAPCQQQTPEYSRQQHWQLLTYPERKSQYGVDVQHGIKAQRDILRKGDTYSTVLLVNCKAKAQHLELEE